MVLDVSGSMGERDVRWDGEQITRLDAAKRAFRLFVDGGDAAGTHLAGQVSSGWTANATRPI